MTNYLELARSVLAQQSAASHAEAATTETTDTTEGGAFGTDIDDAANEYYWAQLHDGDCEYLLGPRRWPGPCAWCGGRLNHSDPCKRLQRDWKLATPMPCGKYKGKAVGEIPMDYVQWAVSTSHLPAQVTEALKERLEIPTE